MELSISQRLRAKLVPIQATVSSRTHLVGGLVEVWCTADVPFDAGQVVAVRVDGIGPGPMGTWRRFTIAASDGHRFRLVLQRNPSGAAAPFFDAVAAGDSLTIRGPEPAVLPPPGASEVLVVADLTGLATIAALSEGVGGDRRSGRIDVALFTATSDVDRWVIADNLGLRADHITTHLDHSDVAERLREWAATSAATRGVLAIGEHGLTRVARSAAIASGVPADRVRTRTYWKPGKRGLE